MINDLNKTLQRCVHGESRRLRLFSVCHTAATASSRPAITLPAASAAQLSRPGRNLPSPPSLWEHMCLCPSPRPKSSQFFFLLSLLSIHSTSLPIVKVFSLPRSLPLSFPPHASLLVSEEVCRDCCEFCCRYTELQSDQKALLQRNIPQRQQQQLGKNGKAEREEQGEKKEVGVQEE